MQLQHITFIHIVFHQGIHIYCIPQSFLVLSSKAAFSGIIISSNLGNRTTYLTLFLTCLQVQQVHWLSIAHLFSSNSPGKDGTRQTMPALKMGGEAFGNINRLIDECYIVQLCPVRGIPDVHLRCVVKGLMSVAGSQRSSFPTSTENQSN